MWNHQFFSNDFRQFLFLYNNNTLGINTRVNAFNAQVDRRCCFCRILNNETLNEETFLHVFFTCPTTRSLLCTLINRLEPRPDPDLLSFREMYWYGINDSGNSFILLAIFDIFRYCVWKFKLRRRVPNANMFMREFDFCLDIVCSANVSFRTSIQRLNLLANIIPALG